MGGKKKCRDKIVKGIMNDNTTLVGVWQMGVRIVR